MIGDIYEGKFTRVPMNPFKVGVFKVSKFIIDVRKANYKVYVCHDDVNKTLNLFIEPPIDQHKHIVLEDKEIIWIGPENLR